MGVIKLDVNELYDVLVIGGGPAGLNAALYAKRKGLNVGIIASSVGGQVIDTSTVENYLGYKSIAGFELVDKFQDHVKDLNVPILEFATVTGVKPVEDSYIREVVLENGSIYKTKTVIIATGSKPRKLGVPGEKQFSGKGVSYCAICDGPMFSGEDLVVSGGGNSAIEAAIDLAKIANKVTVIHRSQLRADQILVDQINKFENVEIKLDSQIEEVVGDMFMNGIKVLDKSTNESHVLEAAGLFIEIGYLPNSDAFKDLLTLNGRNEIIVDKHGRTNIDGIYAAGDVTDAPYKQVITSAADGAVCALSANDYLNVLE